MFERILIANRGAIACRIIRTLKRLGVESVAVYTQADAASLHVRAADHAVCIGAGPAAVSYLDAERILRVASDTGAGAIHPGYGFLSENAAFAEACEGLGIAFVGPAPAQLRAFGLKHTARALARASGVPLLPGSDLVADPDQACSAAAHVGYPVMLKSTAGGGGIGMQLCRDADELAGAFASVQRLARNNFSDAGVFVEKYIGYARHLEVQIFGDGAGQVVALGERDCSIQRRNQKVIEETPAPNLPEPVRDRLRASAIALGRQVAYRSAGTVEFIYDRDAEAVYFLEVNTRLQVEHGVTEAVYGVDLVEWMVRLAAGELPPPEELAATLEPRGHAMQARLYAEDPAKAFQPCAGLLNHVTWPRGQGVRVDTWVEAGVPVSQFYDPMLAKVIVHGPDRVAALAGLEVALGRTELAGIETNREYLLQVLAHPGLRAGHAYTRLLESLEYRPATVDVLDAGTQTTVQDWPGRVGYWDVGVPPSGPMDDLSFRLGNRLLGNPEGQAGLEFTVQGPTLRFNRDAVIALTGAAMAADLDGSPVPFWEPVSVPANGVLRIGRLRGAGARAYLTVQGGIDVPAYLGSRSTFTLGGFGGHGGRALRAGDVLHLGALQDGAAPSPSGDTAPTSASRPPPAAAGVPPAARPAIGNAWELEVLYGPHGAPDYFTGEDMDAFFAAEWEVHYNSSRTGIRLVGPRPRWARADGGEAGLHPSNIHDNAYAIGSIDFTGDMPVILGPDGPSLGGFVCPATVVRAERWKLGQLTAGDRLRFIPISRERALALAEVQRLTVAHLAAFPVAPAVALRGSPVLARAPAPSPRAAEIAAFDELTLRAAGDEYLLVELGPPVLDIRLRARVHALMQGFLALGLPGVMDVTPGVRSLQIHFAPRDLSLDRLSGALEEVAAGLPDLTALEVPSRIVHLPLSWDDPATRLAIDKYQQSVRGDAPWCPSNIEFIRRINGLDSVEAVRRTVFEASYLVLGLGDVYLGAPVATPVDPRHRLVTTKYNPARTWTPENAVGIGGSYLCVYGMEGPGGYQFVGRTLQMWNRFRRLPPFTEGKPWLLRFFDQLRFYPVSAEELLAIREDFPLGRYPLRIEETRFNLRAYQDFLLANGAEIAAFRSRQQAAFQAERERWEASGLASFQVADILEEPAREEALGPGETAVDSTVSGSVWQMPVAEGEPVRPGQVVAVVESMKMEIAIEARSRGVVKQILCPVGTQVAPGRRLLVIAERDD